MQTKTKTEKSFHGVTLKDLFYNCGIAVNMPMAAIELCGLFGCKDAWVSCRGCCMYEDDAQISEQVAAILLGLTDR